MVKVEIIYFLVFPILNSCTAYLSNTQIVLLSQETVSKISNDLRKKISDFHFNETEKTLNKHDEYKVINDYDFLSQVSRL